MGFGRKWVNWIRFCISTVKFSILINGAPEGFFPSERGLRQRDPLSPFLFILPMEGLNNMLRIAQGNGWVKGFNVARNQIDRLEVTHLQYADDTLIFCDADVTEVKYLRVILIIFEAISRLHINWRKSQIFTVNEVSNIQLLAGILGGEIGFIPTIYLGMSLGAKSKSKDMWNGVLKKYEKKLARWKSNYISLGGRLVLINSVLDALPTYMLSLFPIPANVDKRLDTLRRNFLWHGNKEKKGLHLVKWKTLTLNKKKGGVGVRNLRMQNKSLLMKWLWRFTREDQALWRKVIKAKYGKEGFWMTKQVNNAYGTSLWRTIRNLWTNFADKLQFNVRDGRKTLFWEDNWREMIHFVGAKTAVGCTQSAQPTIREAVLTHDNLRRRGMSICSRCYLCGQETINHLFLHCRVTSQLWDLFINLRGIRWSMPGRTSELLSSWNEGGKCTASNKDRWKIVPELPKFITHTNLVLLPKKKEVNTFSDMRPIILSNFITKVFSRVIHARLVGLLPNLISDEKFGFVKGRSIVENVLLTQEIITDIRLRMRAGPNVVIKLDMTKAYDRLS
ncbi:uncharacterized protein LOC142171749 [Nicotiana tabacum]|uniref:Uncharacterized protein LOC142171749 n=1 Tax=Nicotiana tabacum TaxID=4097 RepID=A0AC58T2V6_TOBAC